MPRPAPAPLTPKQALARGQRLIEESKRARAAKEAEAARVEAERNAAGWSREAEGGCATGAEIGADLSTEPSPAPAQGSGETPPPSAGEGGAEIDMGNPISEPAQWIGVVPKVRAATTKPAQNMPEIMHGPVRPSEGERRRGQSASPLTQHGATTPGSRSGGGQAPAGNVAKSRLGPTAHRVEHPSDDLIGTHRIADLREGQCRFACTPDHVRPEDHRFCGAPVTWLRGKPTSWCAEHLARVCGAPGRHAGGMSVAEMRAGKVEAPPEPAGFRGASRQFGRVA